MPSISWTDSNGNLWLFGGLAYDSTAAQGRLNDLWRYEPATNIWTWMGGANTRYQKGTYGIKGIPDAANVQGATVWQHLMDRQRWQPVAVRWYWLR